MADISLLIKRLQYDFSESALLQAALTHRSWGPSNNERLEFLGDSVLGLFIAQELYRRYPKLSEGKLSKLRTILVRNAALAELARKLGLEDHIIAGQGEMKSGGFQRDSVLADAFEALIGAIYLDGGVDAAFFVLQHIYAEKLDMLDLRNLNDSKTQLQEYLQKRSLSLPEYVLQNTTGQSHKPTFTVSCRIQDPELECTVSDRTRKLAEQGAAEQVLFRLRSKNV